MNPFYKDQWSNNKYCTKISCAIFLAMLSHPGTMSFSYAYFTTKLTEIVSEYFRNKNLFRKRKYASPKAGIKYQKFISSQSLTIRGLWVLLNHLHTNLRKQQVYPKNSLNVAHIYKYTDILVTLSSIHLQKIYFRFEHCRQFCL